MSNDLITIELEGEHISWKNELNTAVEEIEKFESQLTKKSGELDAKKIEHFQNQFMIQKGVIGKLKNEIKKHDFAIEREGKKPFDSVDDQEYNFHENIKQRIETELNILKDLKDEFKEFLGK